jgi:hypothetical protein
MRRILISQEREAVMIYIVKRGDTLSSIAIELSNSTNKTIST